MSGGMLIWGDEKIGKRFTEKTGWINHTKILNHLLRQGRFFDVQGVMYGLTECKTLRAGRDYLAGVVEKYGIPDITVPSMSR